MVIFEERSTLGRGDYIEVKRTIRNPIHGRPVPVVIGRIAETTNGQFAYFEPETNELNPTLVEDDLEELKRQVQRRHS